MNPNVLYERMSKICKIVRKKGRDDLDGNVVLVMEGDNLLILGHDKFSHIKSSTPIVEGLEDGRAMANAALLRDVSKSFKHDESIEIESRDSGIMINASASVYVESAGDIKDFPILEPLRDKPNIEMTSDMFRFAIKSTSYAAKKTEHPKFAFHAAELSIDNGLVMTCTDSNRLSQVKFGDLVIHAKDQFPILIPVSLLLSALNFTNPRANKSKKAKTSPGGATSENLQDEEVIEVCFNREKVTLRAPLGLLTCAIPKSLFPDWKKALPKEDESTKFIVNKDELLIALKQATATQDKHDGAVLFEVSSNGIKLHRQVGQDYATASIMDLKGPQIKQIFNRFYLEALLKVISSKSVSASISPDGPSIFRGSQDDYHLLVPMTVGGAQE